MVPKNANRRTAVVALRREPLLLARPLPTLSVTFISRERLNAMFGLRRDTDCMARFIELNSDNFRFLDVEIRQVYEPERKGILISTGRFAGAVPVKSPKTSLYTVDLKVRGNYSPDVDDDELYSLLVETGAELLPEFDEKLQLQSDSVKPPVYIECENFIHLYEKALAANWTKFTDETKVESFPRGITDWSRYARESYNPLELMKFRNRVNSQTLDHREWRQINHVLHKSIGILESSSTPVKARMRNRHLISKLRQMQETQSEILASHIPVHAVDPPVIKELKKVGNMILADSSESRCAWRLDIAKLFEMFVQYIARKAAFDWRCALNPHYPVYGQNASWGLWYLEPDMVLTRDDRQIVIDAKYKANMLGRADVSASAMKDSFREDLHQVLAYSAFEPSDPKHAMLVYPCPELAGDETDSPIRILRQTISSPLSGRKMFVSLVGIPFSSRYIKKVISAFRNHIAPLSWKE